MNAQIGGPLSGVKVLAFEHFIAGPWCTQILADAGAEVIKIERPGIGDPRRHYDPYVESEGIRVSAGFTPFNRNKRSIEVDVTAESGREVLLRLAETADVVVENLRPGGLTRLGLGYEALKERNSGLILCSISGFGLEGRTGPYSERPAFDPVVQAMSGLSSLLGDRDGPPLLAPAGFSDLIAGLWAANAVTLSLAHRAATGQGKHVEVSMYEAMVAMQARALAIHDWTGQVMTRGRDDFTPVGSFKCADGYVSIVIPTGAMWERCCTVIGRPDLLERPELSTDLERSENMRAIIIPALEQWAVSMTQEECSGRLADGGVPAGPVQTVDLVAGCQHLDQREFFVDIDDPVAGVHRYPRLPITFSDFEPEYRRSPNLGEDTDAVLRTAGFGQQEIEALRNANVTGHGSSNG